MNVVTLPPVAASPSVRAPRPALGTYAAIGSGGNFIVVDDQNDLVVVIRWMPSLNDFLKIVLDAVKE